MRVKYFKCSFTEKTSIITRENRKLKKYLHFKMKVILNKKTIHPLLDHHIASVNSIVVPIIPKLFASPNDVKALPLPVGP